MESATTAMTRENRYVELTLAGLSIVANTTKPAAKNEATVVQIGIPTGLVFLTF
jgi:hypothetical protein